MGHAEFLREWRAGRVMVAVDPIAAPRFLSARLLLPFVAIAIIGAGIALVLVGYLWTGFVAGALGILIPKLIKRSAVHFILTQLAGDPVLYEDALRAGILRVEPAAPAGD